MANVANMANGLSLSNGHSSSQSKKQGLPEKRVAKEADVMYNSETSRSRYEAYSRLQASAVAFGEKLPIPEIVAVGGQSDGKSSLLEALLGFRFNVREVEMGTRRPLMLQMSHDPSALEPRCRLQDEDTDDYGPVIMPVSAVAEAIRVRTEEFLKKLGTAVSPKPIVMRAEYAFCPNLTIIDTPGFVLKARKGEPDNTPEEILAMVRQLAAPQHRLLLFLQQSSVEWCSSLWLDVVKSIDPKLQRTMVVVSKFDNRLKEFAERWEVDRYLAAGGYLGDNARPFFVALPKERGTSSPNDEFRRQIAIVDTDILRQLRENVAGGFDEEKFGGHVGFGNLRLYLEAELQRRYRDAAPETLMLLDQRCMEVTAELSAAESKIEDAADVAALRKTGMVHAWSVATHMIHLLDGVDSPDPAKWGSTSEEERSESGLMGWPGEVEEIQPLNSNLRLYGGAAFNRVLHEYKCVACSVECPPVSEEKVASIMQAQSGRRGGPVFVLAQSAARSWLGPLLDTVCSRLAFILRNLYKLAMERIRLEQFTNDCSSREVSDLSVYVAFHVTLRQAHERFIRKLAARAKDLMNHHLSAIISSFEIYGDVNNLHMPTGTSRATLPHQVEDSEEQGVTKIEATDDDEGAGHKDKKQTLRNGGIRSPVRGREEGRGTIRDSQITVLETPTPEQLAAEAKRKEFGLASGRLSILGEPPLAPPEAPGGGKRKRNRRRISVGKDTMILLQSSGLGTSGISTYKTVTSMAADLFGKIRHLLVERTVHTLNEVFLDPFRDQLAIDVSVEVFGVSDDKFLEMFVAPGAVEKLENERAVLQKRCATLQTCLQEFRTLARSL